MVDSAIKEDMLKLLHLVIKDGIDAETPDMRIDAVQKAGNLYVQLLKIDAKTPEEEDDENNFGKFHQRLKDVGATN